MPAASSRTTSSSPTRLAPRTRGRRRPPLERDPGRKVTAAFNGVKAAIHRNHGLMTASRHSIDSAAFWFIALEPCCRQQLMIEATARPPVLVPSERARYSREPVGSDDRHRLAPQLIYDRLVQTDTETDRSSSG